MALRIEKAFGVKPPAVGRTLAIRSHWLVAFRVKRHSRMRMWPAYEIAQTRKREKLIRVRRVLRAG